MLECNHCGAELSFWDKLIDFKTIKLCPKCKQIKETEIKIFVDALYAAGKDNYLEP